MSCLIGVVSSYYETYIVMVTIIITIFLVIGLTLFALQTKYDFTGWAPYLLCALLNLIIFGLIITILCNTGNCQVLNTFYSFIGASIFCCFIVHDTQLIIGGKHKRYKFSNEDHVLAALNLYLDIVNLFLNLLSCSGSRD
jgi:hypothetical protein